MVGEPGWDKERTREDLVEMVEYLHNRAMMFLEETSGLRDQLEKLRIERALTHSGIQKEKEDARSVARALWLCWSYAEKEERDKGLMEWIKSEHPWIMEDQ